MFQAIKKQIYNVSHLWIIFLFMFLIPMAWGIIGRVWRHKSKNSIKSEWLIINIVFALISLIIICFMTIFNRDVTTQALYLNPLKIIDDVKRNEETVRAFTMNVFLFVPFGTSFVFLFKRHEGLHPVVKTVFGSVIVSFIIELIQYTTSIGIAGVDDLIANTLGGLIGTISYPIVYYSKHKHHHKHHSDDHEHHSHKHSDKSEHHHHHSHHHSSDHGHHHSHEHSSEHHHHTDEVVEKLQQKEDDSPMD